MTLVDAKSRQLSVTDRLPLKLLPQEGLSFDEPVSAAWLDDEILGVTRHESVPFEASAPGRARITVEPLAPVAGHPPVLVRGAIALTVETPCVRCLDIVHTPVEGEIETTLFPAQSAAPAGPHHGPKRDRGPKGEEEESPVTAEVDEGVYVGEEIDLPSLIREAVLLALSWNPVCGDEGPCSDRTQRLLDEANRAAREADDRPDPRFDALRALAGKLQGSS